MIKYPRNLVTSNWKIIFGNGFENLVTLNRSKELSTKINIDDITSAERTILLTSTNQHNNNGDGEPSEISTIGCAQQTAMCELQINGKPKYNVSHLTMVCDCSKIELFNGTYGEYIRCCDGELLDEFDGTKSYVFELELPNKMSSSFLLKFITTTDQIWIYGLHMFVTELPMPTLQTLFSQQPNIDLAEVQARLADSPHTLSTNAEKCKEFITRHMSLSASARTNAPLPPNMDQLMTFINMKLNNKSTDENDHSINVDDECSKLSADDAPSTTKGSSAFTDPVNPVGMEMAKMYLDGRLREMEQEITTRIEGKLLEIEQRQSAKLDRILLLLGEKLS